jgi:hypothetical protein
MLERWTNSYLILIFTVVSIILATVGENTVQLSCTNILLGITMLLIPLRDFRRDRDIFSNNRFRVLFTLIVIDFLFDLFYSFNWIPDLEIFFLFSTGLIKVVFFGSGWLSTVRTLARKQKVTDQTIVLAIIAYLFIGIIWSFIYFTVWEINPHAFHITIEREYELQSWNLAMYFSFTTLTTVGYGDIIPVDKWLMVSANFEAMAGAIYLAVIIARLVSLYSTPD